MKYLPKIILVLFFAALLATPLIIEHWWNNTEEAKTVVDKQTALNRYGFYFEEVSKQSGINFIHTQAKLDSKLDHIMPQVAGMGAAVSITDYNHDGWHDIYVTNSGEGTANSLFRNNTDGTFTDVAAQMDIANVNNVETGVSMGVVWGDYDSDGFEDLFLYKWGKPELYHNDAGKSFTRVTERTNFPAWVNANTAIWFDYDRDGMLDIFLGGYFPENINLWKLETTRMMPESFEYAKNGGRKYLFHNLGNGKFEEVSEQMGINTRRWALAAGAADLRGTGYPDLFIANDYGVAELFFNEGGKKFVDAGEKTGVGFAPKSGMNVSFGDVLNRGQFGIYISNISEEGILLQGNNLWLQRAGTSGETLKYDNLAHDMGLELGGWSWGAQFGDLNNDGNLDLFLTNGFVSLDKGTNYWYDYSKITVGNNTIIGDAANWPDMKNRSLAGYQQKRVWLNDGAGKFNDVALSVGVTERFDGRSVALVDLWNRGVLDVVVAHQRAPLLIYKNTVSPENKWIQFELENKIGTQVTVFWSGNQQVQDVNGGIGFCSQNQRRLHFGLGKTDRVEKAVIRWASGKTQTIENPELNKVHRLGTRASLPASERRMRE